MPVTAAIELQAPASVPALQPAPFTIKLTSAGALIDHSDAIFEVREGLDLVFRTHAHTHTEPMQLSYAFPRPGTYRFFCRFHRSLGMVGELTTS